MPWRKFGHVWTEDGFLVTGMAVLTFCGVVAIFIMWRDIRHNRATTERSAQSIIEEVRHNRAVGAEILRRLPVTRPAK